MMVEMGVGELLGLREKREIHMRGGGGGGGGGGEEEKKKEEEGKKEEGHSCLYLY